MRPSLHGSHLQVDMPEAAAAAGRDGRQAPGAGHVIIAGTHHAHQGQIFRQCLQGMPYDAGQISLMPTQPCRPSLMIKNILNSHHARAPAANACSVLCQQNGP